MTPDLIVLDSKNRRSRLILIGAIFFAVVFVWFGVRWQLGDVLASLTPPTDPNASVVASLAVSLAPANPRASWLKASAGEDVSTESTIPAVEGFEQTVRLAPYDYRWRVELGRAFEQDDRADLAEREFKRAVEIAPSYAYPRWRMGNFYLRQNRPDEAFAELKKATDNNTEFRDQVFSLAWDYFDKDATQVEKLAGDQPETRASLAYFFAARGRATDSLRNWNLLSDQDKAANKVFAKSIAQGLFGQRHFPQALEFAKQNGNDPGANAGAITNPGFESPIMDGEGSLFGWQVTRNDSKIEIAADPKVKHLGERSLRVTFRDFIKPALANIVQTVVVAPQKHYRLHYWLRTENLKSAGGPLIELVNGNDDGSIAISKPFPERTDDWQELTIDFTTPQNCEGIYVRTIRQYCGESCPIVGTVWYDDFVLSESGAIGSGISGH